MELTVVERNGWKKLAKFDKAVIRIGSAAANDIQLSSPGIAPIHLQAIHNPENPGNCRVLNLGAPVSMLSGGKQFTIETGSQAQMRDGDEVILGDYHILFTLPLSSKITQSSQQIAASLSVADAVLRPNLPTTGVLKLKNLGAHPNCQFQVAVEGLSEECFRIDPLPILYPGAEEDVRVQFFHRAVTPPAGYLSMAVSVTAPSSYPGEQVVLQQELYVNPLLATGIKLTDDMPIPRVEISTSSLLLGASDMAPESAPGTRSPEASVNPAEDILGTEVPTASEPAVPVEKEHPVPKIVRNPSETYWEETT